ncbi:MAG: phage virion morphogenesis protein [Burkholderia gladioli]
MSDDLSAFEAWAGALLAKLSPAKRRAALVDIARTIRRSQAARIASQANPDGTPYEPRKRGDSKRPGARSHAGRIRRQAMFAKLRTTRWLKVETESDGVSIGFTGRVAQIATVHQEGGDAPVVPGGPTYRYPRRVLLGFTSTDRDTIRDRLLAHLSP